MELKPITRLPEFAVNAASESSERGIKRDANKKDKGRGQSLGARNPSDAPGADHESESWSAIGRQLIDTLKTMTLLASTPPSSAGRVKAALRALAKRKPETSDKPRIDRRT